MKRFCLALITILCVSIPAVAQERWMVNQTATLQALFFTPQIGVNFGKHYYAAAGVWCQWARSQWAALALTASASLRIGVRF